MFLIFINFCLNLWAKLTFPSLCVYGLTMLVALSTTADRSSWWYTVSLRGLIWGLGLRFRASRSTGCAARRRVIDLLLQMFFKLQLASFLSILGLLSLEAAARLRQVESRNLFAFLGLFQNQRSGGTCGAFDIFACHVLRSLILFLYELPLLFYPEFRALIRG